MKSGSQGTSGITTALGRAAVQFCLNINASEARMSENNATLVFAEVWARGSAALP
jgi:hypothetical protein